VIAFVLSRDPRWLRLRLLVAALGVIGFMVLATVGLLPGVTTGSSGGGCGDMLSFPSGVVKACIEANWLDVNAAADVMSFSANRDPNCMVQVRVRRGEDITQHLPEQVFHCPGSTGTTTLRVPSFFGGVRASYQAQVTVISAGNHVRVQSPWLHLA
jgi:hypothetical protein